MAFSGAIIFWLIYAGKLDLSHLGLYLSHPYLAIGSVVLFLFGFIGFQSYRWRLLLEGVGVTVTQTKAMVLQMIGFFFNVAMPGAVGGDFVKAFYVSRLSGEKTKPMLTVILDRILGLISMFVLAAMVTLVSFEHAWSIVALRPFILGSLLVVFCAPLVFFFVYMNRHRDLSSVKYLQGNHRVVLIVKKVVDALWSYREKPMVIFKCVLVGMVVQIFYGVLVYYVCWLVNGEAPGVAPFATAMPFAVLLASIPLAPGGLGIGHAAFENIFMLAGIKNGANIFNVVILGQLLLNLTGAIPYLLYKRSPLPLASQMAEEEMS